MDNNVGIDYFHCGQHYSSLGAFLCCVFGQKLQLGVLLSLPKTVGSGMAAGCWVWLLSHTHNIFKK
jgi:hypothetical protein